MNCDCKLHEGNKETGFPYWINPYYKKWKRVCLTCFIKVIYNKEKDNEWFIIDKINMNENHSLVLALKEEKHI